MGLPRMNDDLRRAARDDAQPTTAMDGIAGSTIPCARYEVGVAKRVG